MKHNTMPEVLGIYSERQAAGFERNGVISGGGVGLVDENINTIASSIFLMGGLFFVAQRRPFNIWHR